MELFWPDSGFTSALILSSTGKSKLFFLSKRKLNWPDRNEKFLFHFPFFFLKKEMAENVSFTRHEPLAFWFDIMGTLIILLLFQIIRPHDAHTPPDRTRTSWVKKAKEPKIDYSNNKAMHTRQWHNLDILDPLLAKLFSVKEKYSIFNLFLKKTNSIDVKKKIGATNLFKKIFSFFFIRKIQLKFF